MTTGKQFKVTRVLNNWTLLDLSIMTLRRISPSKISLFERDLVDLPEDDVALLKRVLNFEKYQLVLEPNLTSNPATTNEPTDTKL